jgi:flagellar FliL protein
MSDQTADDVGTDDGKKSKMPLILGLVACLAGGGAGFFLTFSGMILPDEAAAEKEEAELALKPMKELSFVPLDPMVISVGPASQQRYLRFRAQVEVRKGYEADVQSVMPRIIDILNTYLRALRLEDLEGSDSLLRLRGQMLRRIQVITGEGRVNDLLIMEFVLN